jgi:hypothetical protein
MTAQNFNTALGTDQRLIARWEACREKLTADCRAAGYGDIDPEALKTLPGIKMAVFSDMGLPSDIMEEVKRLPAVQETLQRRRQLAELDNPNSETHAELQRLPPHVRMSEARKLEAQRPHLEAQQQPAPLTAAQEEERLAWILTLSPQQRLSAARSAGLIK